jgi:hypothetical protein
MRNNQNDNNNGLVVRKFVTEIAAIGVSTKGIKPFSQSTRQSRLGYSAPSQFNDRVSFFSVIYDRQCRIVCPTCPSNFSCVCYHLLVKISCITAADNEAH